MGLIMETLPFTRGAGGVLKRLAAEGATEGLQSGIEQTGQTLGTAQGLTLDPKQIAAEAMIGAGAGAGVRPVIDAAGATIRSTGDKASQGLQVIKDKALSKTDDHMQVDEYDLELARLYEAENAAETFNDPYSDAPNGGARGSMDAVEKRLKSSYQNSAKTLKKMTDDKGIKEEIDALKSLGLRTGRVEADSFDKLDSHFGNDADYQKFKGTIIMAKRNTELRSQNNLTGGIGGAIDKTLSGLPIIGNKFTPLRNAGDTSLGPMIKDAALGAGIGAMTGGVGLGAIAAIPAAKFAIKSIDTMTNRRSNPKRWLDTVNKAQQESRVLPKEMVTGEALAMANQVKAERDASLTKPDGSIGISPLTLAANKGMFETGAIPDTEFHKPYKIWQEQIGKNPKEILAAMQAMEQSGELTAGTSANFEGSIRSFKTKGKGPKVILPQ